MWGTWFESNRALALAGAVTVLGLTGCASSKPQAKAIHERPWIGGSFESVKSPKAAREEGRHFGRWGVLVTEAPSETPLHNAGLEPSDVILAVNDKNVRWAGGIGDALRNDAPLKFTVYRKGEFLEKTVNPGIERYQDENSFIFGIGFATRYTLDVWPDPDFSLLAVGYKEDKKRVDLRSAKGRYLHELREKEHLASAEETWQGLPVEEGWKAWLGPISFAQNKVIVSQSASSSK